MVLQALTALAILTATPEMKLPNVKVRAFPAMVEACFEEYCIVKILVGDQVASAPLKLCDVEVPGPGKNPKKRTQAAMHTLMKTRYAKQTIVILPQKAGCFGDNCEIWKKEMLEGKETVWVMGWIAADGEILNYQLVKDGNARYAPIGCGRPVKKASKNKTSVK